MTLPPFQKLPLKQDGPPYNAWGLYGEDDELGRVNLITPDAVRRGRDAIEHGIRINLNLPLSLQNIHPGRDGLKHTVTDKGYCLDDRLEFNTQNSTQWDSLRHYPYQNWPKEGQYVYFNGLTEAEARDQTSLRNGIHNLAKSPVTSRGVLLDVAGWLKATGQPRIEAWSMDHPISAQMLKDCASYQNVTLESGDVLLIRTGYDEQNMSLSDEEIAARRQKTPAYCGLDQTEEILDFVWSDGISAIVSDSPAVEAYRPAKPPFLLHEVFIAGWGLILGELFDLRELAACCANLRKWTFMFCSIPLYVPGGIASPANAQAIL